MLELRNLHFKYGAVSVLKGIELVVREGETVALVGANGAGKTTTLRCISGILHPEQGEILFGDRDLLHCRGPHEIARLGIGHVLEGRRVFTHLTVQENLELGAYRRRDRSAVKRDFEEIFQLFPRLQERISQYAGTLSGGEQQMLALARSLMSKPNLLLMDEPTMGLAPEIVLQLGRIIRQIGERGTTILLVEQNARLALGLADRGYVLELGKTVLSDSGENLLSNEQVLKSYLGED